jgi:hypothetical protein
MPISMHVSAEQIKAVLEQAPVQGKRQLEPLKTRHAKAKVRQYSKSSLRSWIKDIVRTKT